MRAEKQSPVITFGEALDSFLLAKRVMGLSHYTIKLYQLSVQQLIAYLGDPPLNQVSPGEIRRFIAHLQEGLSPTTVAIRFRSIRAFFNWLEQEGLLRENPIVHIKLPKTPKQYPFILTDAQVQALLRVARERVRTWYGLRDYTIILTLLDCGLRCQELINLTMEDLDMPRRSLRVMGKGSRERQVYFGRKLARVLTQWISKRTLSLPGDSLFCTRDGYPLNRHNLNRTLHRLAARAGITGVRCSPHTLRHTFATNFIRNGGDPFALQRLLGHSHIETTLVYVHLAGSTLRKAHAKASPVDRLMER